MRQIEKESDILEALVDVIDSNAKFLSEIDGVAGDGDHGVNMRKGFLLFRENNNLSELNLSNGFKKLGDILLNNIGGSMGPLYGLFFITMGEKLENQPLELNSVCTALESAYNEILDVAGSKVGDKTLIDVLFPSINAFKDAINNKLSISDCLDILSKTSIENREKIKDMVAKVGRASRLGERSKGLYDPGAYSCSLLLDTLALGLKEIIK